MLRTLCVVVVYDLSRQLAAASRGRCDGIAFFGLNITVFAFPEGWVTFTNNAH